MQQLPRRWGGGACQSFAASEGWPGSPLMHPQCPSQQLSVLTEGFSLLWQAARQRAQTPLPSTTTPWVSACTPKASLSTESTGPPSRRGGSPPLQLARESAGGRIRLEEPFAGYSARSVATFLRFVYRLEDATPANFEQLDPRGTTLLELVRLADQLDAPLLLRKLESLIADAGKRHGLVHLEGTSLLSTVHVVGGGFGVVWGGGGGEGRGARGSTSHIDGSFISSCYMQWVARCSGCALPFVLMYVLQCPPAAALPCVLPPTPPRSSLHALHPPLPAWR